MLSPVSFLNFSSSAAFTLSSSLPVTPLYSIYKTTASGRYSDLEQAAKLTANSEASNTLNNFFMFSPYSLTEPSMMPEIKYFCINGYAMMMGSVETTTVAIFTFSAKPELALPPEGLTFS